MTKRIRLSNLLFVLGLFALPVAALAGDDVEKKKNINKSYNVSSSDKLSINNQFGDVVITTWTKSEIKVDIEISVEASTDEKAQKLLDGIEVHESKNGGNISFKTDVNFNNKGENRNKKGEKTEFHINYNISMPAVNPLDVENSFGKLTVPDMKGQVDIASKFGSLTAGKLDNVKEVLVEFGNATIESVRNGRVTFKFNDKSIVKNLGGDVKLTSEFSGNVQLTVDEKIEQLSVYESYSSVKMLVPKSLSASFDIHTSFGSLKNSSSFTFKDQDEDEDERGPKFDRDYIGKAGDGKGKIKIKSSFGSIRLTHDAADMEKKEEKKSKSKDKKKDKDDEDDDDDDDTVRI